MNKTLSKKIEISVKPKFEEIKSSWENNSLVHSYEVKIRNLNLFPVKILERCWFIFDSTEGSYTVFGEGVIGQKPIINPGEEYSYSSYCEMSNLAGRMRGFYNLRNEETGEVFKATIPTFNLEVPFFMN